MFLSRNIVSLRYLRFLFLKKNRFGKAPRKTFRSADFCRLFRAGMFLYPPATAFLIARNLPAQTD